MDQETKDNRAAGIILLLVFLVVVIEIFIIGWILVGVLT